MGSQNETRFFRRHWRHSLRLRFPPHPLPRDSYSGAVAVCKNFARQLSHFFHSSTRPESLPSFSPPSPVLLTCFSSLSLSFRFLPFSRSLFSSFSLPLPPTPSGESEIIPFVRRLSIFSPASSAAPATTTAKASGQMDEIGC